MTVDGGISHHGEPLTVDEDLTPTLDNTIVVLWLRIIHPGLPSLVKQKYGSELRNKSIASLKPEITQSLPSLMDELRTLEEFKAMRIDSTRSNRPYQNTPRRNLPFSCIL